MRRREFIIFLSGAAAACPIIARAQQGERMRRVGILMPYSPSDKEIQNRVQAFKEELRNRGWTTGVNIQFDERWTTDNMDLIRAAATNLVELKPDVVIATGGRVIPILMQLTSSIPIIVPGGTDPVERGWVKSLARPGGNVTGFSQAELTIIGNMLQTLKEIAPNVSHVAMIYNPDNPAAAFFGRSFEDAARSLAIERSSRISMVLPTLNELSKPWRSAPMAAVFSPSTSRSVRISVISGSDQGVTHLIQTGACSACTFFAFFAVGNTGGGGPNGVADVLLGSIIANVPLPGALPLFVTGMGLIGLLASRRKRKLLAF